MTHENARFSPQVPAAPPAADLYLPFPLPAGARRAAMQGLSGHVRQMQRRNEGISRWLLFAVLGGAIVAFAMVQLAIR
jgi:hypothetical protein